MKKTKILVILVVLILATIVLISCSKDNKTQSSTKIVKLKLDMPVPMSSSWGVAAETFAEEINKRTEGRYEITVYPDSQLAGGSQTKALEMLQSNDIDVTIHGVLTWAGGDVRIAMPAMPWLFDSWEDAESKMKGKGGDLIKEIVTEKGAHALAFGISGFRQLFNNVKPILTPEDLIGIKIRVPGNPMYVDLFKILGADPVTMNASELYTALAQGAVDGQENPADMTITQKFCEVLKYMTTWGYSCEPIILSTSLKVWESLTSEDKKAFEEAAIIACEAQIKAAKERDFGYMEQLVDEFKIHRTDLTAIQLEAFKAKSQKIYDQYRSIMGQDLYRAFGVQ